MTAHDQIFRATITVALLRAQAAVLTRRLQMASQLAPMPAGFIDLMQDVTALEPCLDRLKVQIDALAEGKELPA